MVSFYSAKVNEILQGVNPSWEDAANCKGGHFTIEVDSKLGDTGMDAIWENMVFELVGEMFPFSENITGFRYMNKPKKNQLKVELWLRHDKPSSKDDPVFDSYNQIQKHFEDLISRCVPAGSANDPNFDSHDH